MWPRLTMHACSPVSWLPSRQRRQLLQNEAGPQERRRRPRPGVCVQGGGGGLAGHVVAGGWQAGCRAHAPHTAAATIPTVIFAVGVEAAAGWEPVQQQAWAARSCWLWWPCKLCCAPPVSLVARLVHAAPPYFGPAQPHSARPLLQRTSSTNEWEQGLAAGRLQRVLPTLLPPGLPAELAEQAITAEVFENQRLQVGHSSILVSPHLPFSDQ